LSYAAETDKQTNRQIKRTENKQTISNVLTTPTDIVGMGNEINFKLVEIYGKSRISRKDAFLTEEARFYGKCHGDKS